MKSRCLIAILFCSFYVKAFSAQIQLDYDVKTIKIVENKSYSEPYAQVLWDEALQSSIAIGNPEIPIFHHLVNIPIEAKVADIKVTLYEKK